MYQAALALPRSAPHVTVEDRLYAAGLFDGEGCVVIRRQSESRRKKPQYVTYALIAMTDPAPLDFLRSKWGGTIRSTQPRQPEGATREWKRAHRLLITGVKTERFFADIAPFCRVKQAQVRLALDFRRECIRPRSAAPRPHRSVADIERCDWYCDEAKRLKREVVG